MNRPALVTSTTLLALVVSLPGVSFGAPSGRDVMSRNEDTSRTDDITADATLTTGGGGNPQRVKQFTWWRKLRDDKRHNNTLTRFHAPAEVRNEGILFLEHDSNSNEVLLYLPTFKKIRRVESQQQSGSFMGSDLSYSDVATPHAEDYTQKLLTIEDCPGAEHKAVKCYVVESVPANPAVRERTGYSRTVSWVRSDNFVMVKGEYYGLDGKLSKRVIADQLSQVDPGRHKWLALRVRVDNVANRRFTLLQFANVKVNKGIPDFTFTQQNLSREQ